MNKVEHIRNNFYPANPTRVFYPIDKEGKSIFILFTILGVVDEWDALVKSQTYQQEMLDRRKKEEIKQKKL